MNWLVIVNPQAGGGSAGRKWKRVEELLLESGITFDHRMTSGPLATREATCDAVSLGYSGVAVYGGDGTLSDAASVLSGNLEVPLAVIPAGSGNDWARSIGFASPTVEASVAAMRGENFRTVDTAVARFDQKERFILNSSGTGLDALVLKRAVALRRYLPLNRTCYAVSLLFSALLPPVWQGEFSRDGRVFYRGGYITFTAGVGCYSGGGMRLSPSAVPDDGMLDALCLTPMNFFIIAGNLKRVFDGNLGKTQWAREARGNVITLKPIAGGSSLLLELDGEPVRITGKTPLELISVPESLRVSVP